MEEIILKLSKELSKRGIFHKRKRTYIKTKKSKIKIPKPNIDVAYLLGIIAGDGSLSRTKREKGGYHYTFRIYSGNEENLEYLNNLFNLLFEIKGKIVRDKRKESAYHLVIKNAILFFYFVCLGSEIGKKKRGKVPGFAKLNNKNLLNYLAGLVDTDGHISHRRIQLKQKNHSLLKEINKLSGKLNLNCSIPKVNFTDSKPYYYIRFDNKLPLRLKKAF